MKLKNIPADITTKSIKEAQTEIKEIIAKLEDKNADLKSSLDQYNRMLYLNLHIHEQFKKKANQIKKSPLNQNKKKSQKI